MELSTAAATATHLASEEDDDSASVDVPSTQEESAKGEEDEDDEDEEMEMTEEDDDEDLEMTEEELLDGDAKSTDPRSSSATSAARGALASGASAGAAPKRAKKKVRISDVSTVHGDGRTYNDDDDDDDERESTVDEDDDEEEEDDEDDDDDDSSRKKQQSQVFDKIELSDSASMLRMIQSLPELEARRHEQFRRSHFERGAIKRCMAKVIQECSAADKRVPSVNNVMAIVMAGMTKVFVGEITAEARRTMEKNGETGPIRPRHLREAHRKYYARRPLARGRNLRRLLR